MIQRHDKITCTSSAAGNCLNLCWRKSCFSLVVLVFVSYCRFGCLFMALLFLFRHICYLHHAQESLGVAIHLNVAHVLHNCQRESQSRWQSSFHLWRFFFNLFRLYTFISIFNAFSGDNLHCKSKHLCHIWVRAINLNTKTPFWSTFLSTRRKQIYNS